MSQTRQILMDYIESEFFKIMPFNIYYSLRMVSKK